MIFQNQIQSFQNQICHTYIDHTSIALWSRQKNNYSGARKPLKKRPARLGLYGGGETEKPNE